MLRAGGDFRPLEAETLLQVLFVADEHIDVFNDAAQDLVRACCPALRLPQLLAVVEVERGDDAGLARGLHGLDDKLGSSGGERREDAAGVKPAHALGENALPIEVAGLELRGGLVAAVVEDDGSAGAEALVAIDSGHVGAAYAVVLEHLIHRLDAHGTDALVNEIPYGVIDHRAGDAGVELKAIGEIGGYIELATA